MTRKIYRTANGKMVDLGALQLQNEHIRAVGNMGVNARGDIIDSSNKTIKTRNQQVAKQYRRQTNVSDTPIVSRKTAPASEPVKAAKAEKTKAPTETAPITSAPAGGLAAAIARAREIKQEPLDPAPSRNNNGVTKI